MKKALLPVVAEKPSGRIIPSDKGRTALTEIEARTEFARVNAASQAIEAQTMKRMAQLNVVSQAVGILDTIVRGMDQRETLRVHIEREREAHQQFMERFGALQTYIREFRITELATEDQRPFHQAFLDLIRRS